MRVLPPTTLEVVAPAVGLLSDENLGACGLGTPPSTVSIALPAISDEARPVVSDEARPAVSDEARLYC